MTGNMVFSRFTEAGTQKCDMELAPASQDLIPKALKSRGRKVSKNDVFAMSCRGRGAAKNVHETIGEQAKNDCQFCKSTFFRIPIWWR